MVDALGADSGTFAVVAGAFFLGLSLGSLAASRFVPKRPAFAIAAAETSVALLAVVVLLVARSDWFLAVPPAAAEVLKNVLPLVLVGLPAAAMGLVFPWLVWAIHATPRATVALYAVNTVGGVAGIAATCLAILPGLGLTAAVLITATANLFAAILALGLHPSRAANPTARESAPRDRNLAALAFGSGFLILAQETVVQHQVAQITINSLFSSAAVLTAVLVALAAAAALNPLVPRLSRVAPALALAALACAAQPFVFSAWTGNLIPLSWKLAPPAYYAQTAALLAITVVPLFFAAGLVFPAALRLARPSQVGVLLAWNGLGGWLGAEMTNRFLAPTFGLWQTVLLFGCGYAALLTLRRPTLAIAAIVVVIVALPFAARLPQAAAQRGEHISHLTVAREGVVALVQRNPRDRRILFNNTYSLGGSLARRNQERQAHLPILLHGGARNVATLGVATGSTLAGAAQHPDVERLTAIELSPAAARIAREEFSTVNEDVFADLRIDLRLGDARWEIARHAATYDVVVGDLFLPWRTGEGRLFTREHFENVRRSLRPDGLFCQWLPLFQLTRAQFDVIVRTFSSVFPGAFLVRGDFYADQPIVGLVGGRVLDSIRWDAVETAARRISAATSDPLVTHAEGVAMLTLGPAPEPGPGPINTLGNAWLEWNAGRNVVGLAEPWFTDDAFRTFAADLSAASRDHLPTDLRDAHAGGEKLARDPGLRPESVLPASLRDDLTADWTEWPGRPKPFAR